MLSIYIYIKAIRWNSKLLMTTPTIDYRVVATYCKSFSNSRFARRAARLDDHCASQFELLFGSSCANCTFGMHNPPCRSFWLAAWKVAPRTNQAESRVYDPRGAWHTMILGGISILRIFISLLIAYYMILLMCSGATIQSPLWLPPVELVLIEQPDAWRLVKLIMDRLSIHSRRNHPGNHPGHLL